MGAGLALMTVWMEKHHVGALGQDWSLSPVERILVAGRALWFYAAKLIWPTDLTFIYRRWPIDPSLWWSYAFPLAALGVMAVLWFARTRLGKGPLVAVLVFAGSLVPALGFVDVYPMRYSFVADHFQYLASVGLITLATALAARAVQRLPPSAQWLGPACGGALLLVLGALSWRQEAAYANRETLWKDTLTKDPACWMAHYNLGKVFLEQEKLDEAMEQFDQALASNPRLVEAHCIWVEACIKQGDLKAAQDHLELARDLNPSHLQVAISCLNVGAALANRGRLEAALGYFRSALEVNPQYVAARYYLGVALAKQGHWEEAEQQLTAALEIPSDLEPDVHNELGEVYARQERWAEAVSHYRQAVQLRPRIARYHQNLGEALRGLGDVEGAAAEFREAQNLQQQGRFR
jgi:tetratricopeptide (TPR) repeat protein